MTQVSLAVARQEVARRATEFIQGTDTGGNTTTIVDTNNLNFVDGYWAEAWVLGTSGANNDILRRTSAFTGSTATLTVYQAFGSSFSGLNYDLYRRFNPFTDIKNAINRALNVGAPDFREKHRDVITATMNTTQYALPTTMMDKGLVGIEYQWYVNAPQSDWPYQKVTPDLYEIIESWDATNGRVAKTLQLKFNPETNKLIRLVFDSPLPNVASSNDNIHLDIPELEWLYTQATAELWTIEAMRTNGATKENALATAARAMAEAKDLRARLAPESPPRPLKRTTFRAIPGRASGWW
jgi:hypothetical protein